MRKTAGIVLTALLAVATPALGAHEPTCKLIVDAYRDDTVDQSGSVGVPAASAGSLDIVSADIASDQKHVTAVIRLRSLTAVDPAATSGANYEMHFTVGRKQFVLSAERTVGGGQRFTLIYLASSKAGVASHELLGRVDGVFDHDASEVRITTPTAAIDRVYRIRRGDRLDGLRVEVERAVGSATESGFTLQYDADEATTSTTYRAGAPSCVAVGK